MLYLNELGVDVFIKRYENHTKPRDKNSFRHAGVPM